MTQLQLTPNAQVVLAKRYLLRNAQGEPIETPADLFRRVARHIAVGDLAYGVSQAQVETLSETFYGLMASLAFLPNSPTLMNAGRPPTGSSKNGTKGQLSACFVLPIEDSMESIFETLKHAALIHQSGGGTGFSFSRLRPKNDVVNSTMGVSSGPVSFMEVYNAATEAIKQGGARRGANMGILRIDHPDIEEFIHAKQNLRKVTNFNISIAITDAFMAAVEADSPFDLLHPNTGKTVKTVSARHLFEQIVHNAWQTGEPGLFFIDRVNADQPTPKLGAIEATNPCGEVPLLPYEACNLGSINLGRMLDESGQLDWEKLKTTVYQAVHFLDNVITQNHFPLSQIQAMVEGNRKIGLGVMGWADLLIALGIPYNSEAAIALAYEVAAWIDYQSKRASVELAKTRGRFPNFDHSRYAEASWLVQKYATQPTPHVSAQDWQALEQEIACHGLRHATTTCIAPTGTIGIIAGASGGIEPLFAIAYTRNILDGAHLSEVHSRFEAVARAGGFYREDMMAEMAHQGSLQSISEIPEEIKHVFVTTHDIAPDWHVRMQAAFQAFVDNGVSKTINFPEQATEAQVAETYRMAYRLGLKGITVYRNNSRQDQPMALAANAEGDLPAALPTMCETCVD